MWTYLQSVIGKDVLSKGSAHLGSPSDRHTQHLIPYPEKITGFLQCFKQFFLKGTVYRTGYCLIINLESSLGRIWNKIGSGSSSGSGSEGQAEKVTNPERYRIRTSGRNTGTAEYFKYALWRPVQYHRPLGLISILFFWEQFGRNGKKLWRTFSFKRSIRISSIPTKDYFSIYCFTFQTKFKNSFKFKLDLFLMLRQIRKKAKSYETLILLMYLRTLHLWTHVSIPWWLSKSSDKDSLTRPIFKSIFWPG